MTTMTDVATAVGVSIQTISAVINDKPGISEATRARVRHAIAELDYHPNMLASGLRSRRTRTIGVLISSITNPYFPEIVRGVEDVAHREGYALFLCNTDEDSAKQLDYLRLLRRHNVAGLVAVSGTGAVDGRRIPEWLVAHEAPVVLMGGDRTHEKIVTTGVDDHRGGYLATAHLLDLGHQRIGVVTGPPNHGVSLRRMAGYEEALRGRDIPPDPKLVVPGGFDAASGQSGARRLMALDTPPTAIIAGNDLAAIGAMAVLKRLGRRIPEDVAVVGYDNIEMAALYDPPLTTVAQPLYDMGAFAMQAILDRIADPRLGGTHRIFETPLIVRRSTLATWRDDEQPQPGETPRKRTPGVHRRSDGGRGARINPETVASKSR